MTRKKRQKRIINDATMLQKSGFSPGGHNAKTEEDRERFLEAFEKTCGNISASCEYAGIDRRTYYRWIKSKEPHNVEFQLRIAEIRPKERLKDLAEAVLLKHLEAYSLDAAKLVLERLAQDRGYGKQVVAKNEYERVVKAVERLQKVYEIQRAKNPDWKMDLTVFAQIAAEDFGVPLEAIEKEYLKRHPQTLGDIG